MEKEASYYKKLGEERVKCELCPHFCFLKDGETGKCKVRRNIEGVLYSLSYENPVSVAIDPIEKKPLYHFLPGTKSFSIGMAGCNLSCAHCQNWELSQSGYDKIALKIKSTEIIRDAQEHKCLSVSYTYSEPNVSYEYVLEISRLAREKGIRNVSVTNGFINLEPLNELCRSIQASNIDLKSISDDFYRNVCGAKLKPVLDSIKLMHKRGVWIEITNLIIPGLNDSEKEIKKLILWVKENLGVNVPLHFSAFYPTYKMLDLPKTTAEKLQEAREIAMKAGLNYVYTGNITDKEGNNTYCPKCRKLLIKRRGFNVLENSINKSRCPECQEKIAGVWQ